MNETAKNEGMPRLALLAGGLATRLGSLTATVPKSMLPVAGEPFIAHQLRLLVRHGIREVVICAGFLGEQIREFVGDGSIFDCRVDYVFDGEPLKGTGGAIRAALPFLGDHFFIMYGDSYLSSSFVQLRRFFDAKKLLGVMSVFKNENCWGTSNVELRGDRVVRYDKRTATPAMKHIDYGVSILRAECFDPWRDGEIFDLALVYQSLIDRGQLGGFEVNERFFEIGSQQGLDETNEFLVCLQTEGKLEQRGN